MSLITRRNFLTATSLTAASAILAREGLCAEHLPDDIGFSSHSANELLPEPTSASNLRALAVAAVDAGKQAGASYVDVRVAERHFLSLRLWAAASLMPETHL